MSAQQQSGKEQKQQKTAREPAQTAEQTPEWALPGAASATWGRATSQGAPVGSSDILSLQRTVGNHSVQRLNAMRMEEGCCGDEAEPVMQEELDSPRLAPNKRQVVQRHGDLGQFRKPSCNLHH